MDVQELGSVMDDVARRTTAGSSRDEALALIVRTARDTIPGADHVTISLARRGGDIETLAASDDFVRELDAVQYELGEGPCIDAIQQRERRTSHDLAHEDRWPRFAPWAVQAGVRSQMGLDLFDEGSSIGGLNVYAQQPSAFTDGASSVAMLFGAQASHVLGRRMRETQLTQALRTRQMIGQATGIVMARYQLSAERAFEFLTRVSQQGNVKLATVAAELIEQTAPERGGRA